MNKLGKIRTLSILVALVLTMSTGHVLAFALTDIADAKKYNSGDQIDSYKEKADRVYFNVNWLDFNPIVVGESGINTQTD